MDLVIVKNRNSYIAVLRLSDTHMTLAQIKGEHVHKNVSITAVQLNTY